MSTRTRFEKEAKGNSEMAYCRTFLACGQAPAWVLGELAEYSLGRVG